MLEQQLQRGQHRTVLDDRDSDGPEDLQAKQSWVAQLSVKPSECRERTQLCDQLCATVTCTRTIVRRLEALAV